MLRNGILGTVLAVGAVALAVGVPAAPAVPRSQQAGQVGPVEFFAAVGLVSSDARAAFGKQYGCVLNQRRYHIDFLITAQAHEHRARAIVKRRHAGAFTTIRVIKPLYGQPSMDKAGDAVARALGFHDPNYIYESVPPQHRPAPTRCSTFVVKLSKQAPGPVRAKVKKAIRPWGDRVHLRNVPPSQIPPLDQRGTLD